MEAIKRGARRPVYVTATFFLLTVAAMAAADEPGEDGFLKCQSMKNDADRLACYDSLGRQSVVVPESAAAPDNAPMPAAPVAVKPAPAAPAEAVPVLDDNIGRESLESKGDDKVAVRGQVVKCYKDVRDKYVFNFANGQIWRQKGNKRIRWKDCDFEVTITKDFFGYQMKPDGDDKSVRIARVR